jgi:hypothetical protein
MDELEVGPQLLLASPNNATNTLHKKNSQFRASASGNVPAERDTGLKLLSILLGSAVNTVHRNDG